MGVMIKAVCDRCGDVRDLNDLNDAGRAMLAKHGGPGCFNGCGKMRIEVAGAITQMGPVALPGGRP